MPGGATDGALFGRPGFTLLSTARPQNGEQYQKPQGPSNVQKQELDKSIPII
jgi:hypothetical protein